MATTRYSTEFELATADTSQALSVLAVPPGSVVLDIGAADGLVARHLVDRGCRVIAVELDPQRASVAEQVCERVVVEDIETVDLASALDGQTFDAVLLLDVLEHLRDPLATLKAATARLRPGGQVIVSVPNVTHAALRLQLLGGRFPYTHTGLLDRTHLHFFDRPAFEQLFADAELTVTERMRTKRGLTETEIAIDPDAFPAEAVALALNDEDAETYQFVYVAVPGSGQSSSPGTVSLAQTLQRQADAAERQRVEVESYARSLESRITELEGESARLAEMEQHRSQRILELESELEERMQELTTKYDELAHTKLDIAVKDAQLVQLHTELAPMRARLDSVEQAMGYARHRIVDRVSMATKRVPRVHHALKRMVERLASRR